MARKPDLPHPKFSQGLHLRPKLRDLRVGECPGNSADQTGDAKPWTRRIPPARQLFMTTRLDRAGEVGHCWFIQPAREISRKRNGSRHFDIASSHYRRRQELSPAVPDRSSFRAIRAGPRMFTENATLSLRLRHCQCSCTNVDRGRSDGTRSIGIDCVAHCGGLAAGR